MLAIRGLWCIRRLDGIDFHVANLSAQVIDSKPLRPFFAGARHGAGVATVAERKTSLRAGTLLLIERGTTHEIRNTGRSQLKTLNLYVPPAYTRNGDELPRGKK
jgi:hypothetical protein